MMRSPTAGTNDDGKAQRKFDLHITPSEFDSLVLTKGVPKSPTFKEACAALGIIAKRDLIPKFFDDFHEQGIDPELQKIRTEHYETKRHEMLRSVFAKRRQLVEEEEKAWRQMAIEENENTFATGGHADHVATSPSHASKAGTALDSDLISREQRQLQKIRIRQQQELEQMMAYEMKVAMMRKQNEDKLEKERLLKEKQARLREEKQKKWDRQKRQQEIERQKKEKELEIERRRLAEKMHRVAKAQAEREKIAEEQRRKEAREKELERMRKKEELEAQTQAILKEQQRQVEIKKQEIEKRDAERRQALEERRIQHAKEQAKKRKQQRDRVESARANHGYLLDKQRQDFAQRQKQALDRQRRFQEEQALQQEQLREQAANKAEEIKRTKKQMEKIQKLKRDNIKAHEKRINDRMLQRELEAQQLAKINHKLQHDKNIERKLAYDQMQANLEAKKKKIMDTRAAKQAIAEKRHKEQNKSNAVQEELRRLREQDRKDALERKKRKDEYEKAKILKKIADDNSRTAQLKEQRDALYRKCEEFRRKAEEDRNRVLERFDEVKKTGNFEATKSILGELAGGETTSEKMSSNWPMSSRSAKQNPSGALSPQHGLAGSPNRPRSAGSKARRKKLSPRVNKEGSSSSRYDPTATAGESIGIGGRAVRRTKGKQHGHKRVTSGMKRRGRSKNKSDTVQTSVEILERKESSEEASKVAKIEQLRKQQNQNLLAILEEEQKEEERREKVYQSITDNKELRKLEKVFGIERAQASAKIMQTAEKHERALKDLMQSLQVDL